MQILLVKYDSEIKHRVIELEKKENKDEKYIILASYEKPFRKLFINPEIVNMIKGYSTTQPDNIKLIVQITNEQDYNKLPKLLRRLENPVEVVISDCVDSSYIDDNYNEVNKKILKKSKVKLKYRFENEFIDRLYQKKEKEQ